MDATWAMAWLATVSVGLTLYGALRRWAPEGVSRAWRSSSPQRGPLPGYAIYPARVLQPSLQAAAGGLLEVVCLEAFHQPKRQRLVVTARERVGLSRLDARAVAEVAQRVCEEAARRTGVEVVALEICASPSGPLLATDWVAIYSRDRLGWSGEAAGPRFVLATPASTEPAAAGMNDEESG